MLDARTVTDDQYALGKSSRLSTALSLRGLLRIKRSMPAASAVWPGCANRHTEETAQPGGEFPPPRTDRSSPARLCPPPRLQMSGLPRPSAISCMRSTQAICSGHDMQKATAHYSRRGRVETPAQRGYASACTAPTRHCRTIPAIRLAVAMSSWACRLAPLA